MPCLRLTRPQAQRLFGLRADVCDRILGTLLTRGTLTRESDDRDRLTTRRLMTALSESVMAVGPRIHRTCPGTFAIFSLQ